MLGFDETNTLCYWIPQFDCSAIDCMPESILEEMGLKRKEEIYDLKAMCSRKKKVSAKWREGRYKTQTGWGNFERKRKQAKEKGYKYKHQYKFIYYHLKDMSNNQATQD